MKTLPATEYRRYMESEEWEATKAWWRRHRGPKRRRCQVCHDRHYDLHHRTYDRLGDERLRDLVPLCRRHHQAVHRLERVLMRGGMRRRRALRWSTSFYVRRRLLVLAVMVFAITLR